MIYKEILEQPGPGSALGTISEMGPVQVYPKNLWIRPWFGQKIPEKTAPNNVISPHICALWKYTVNNNFLEVISNKRWVKR